MVKEIERRFLVYPVKLPKLFRGQKITQGYLSTDPVVRARVKVNRSYLTIKFRKNYINIEYEYKIPLIDAKKLINQCDLKIIKTRYYFRLNGLVWEIDFFEGANKGLIIAEIELSSRASKFQKPLWLSKEITKDDRYLNVNLAAKPYKQWKDNTE